ncbi:hypothetical protein [Vibrio parahaemolyticus]|uniref:hypothetical protein n=1 Tax=Vibrio parahaemolyticus TaxID=670 RepID=UPI00111DCFF5|nr:hypothetical protein [Vibrio parahaemolyticus]TOL31416.1 hypothetical protein CGI01_17560 [Vibrio parahaemolyticus]HAS6776043.1 hypothetical protein [Vibrio parahaemolyticus]HAS6993176.1 hypothetical protein [Vibrio parahaemolyticus]
MISYISSVLLAIGASAAVLGKISYVALIMQLIINLFIFKVGKKKLFILTLIFFYFLILHAFHFTFDSYKQLDISIVNIVIQIFVVATIGVNVRGVLIVRRSLLIQLLFSILVSIYGVVFNDYSMFVNASHTKGFASFFIPTGIYSTPQAFASVSLVVFLLYRAKIIKLISFLTMVFSINRTIMLIFLTNSFLKYYRLIITLLVIALPFLLGYLVESNSVINLRTILSRLYLFEGAASQMELGNFRQIMFGTLSTIDFYLPMYGVTKNYIESSILFIFKYFGVLGLFAYIFYGLLLSAISFRNKQVSLLIVFFLYFFVAQLMTHEFLVSSYYQIVYIFTALILLRRSSINV